MIEVQKASAAVV